MASEARQVLQQDQVIGQFIFVAGSGNLLLQDGAAAFDAIDKPFMGSACLYGGDELIDQALPLALRHQLADPPVCNDLHVALDRKSTRLNSSHVKISYAVFCLKKKKK